MVVVIEFAYFCSTRNFFSNDGTFIKKADLFLKPFPRMLPKAKPRLVCKHSFGRQGTFTAIWKLLNDVVYYASGADNTAQA